MEVLLILIGFFAGIIIASIEFEVLENLKKNKNKVHFYVARDKDRKLWLYLGKPVRKEVGFFACNKHGKTISNNCYFENFGLNENNYKDLEWEDEPIEVFLNLED